MHSLVNTRPHLRVFRNIAGRVLRQIEMPCRRFALMAGLAVGLENSARVVRGVN
jgi:hypothetical protein